MQLPAAILAVIILISGFVVFKNLPINQPQPTADKGFQATMNQQAEASPSASLKPTVSYKPTPKPSTKASSSPAASSSSSNTTNNSSNNSSGSSNNATSTTNTTASTAPSSTPAPTPPSYTYSGNNVNVTVSCFHGESTFDISFSGSLTTQASDDGIWGVITGGNPSPLYFLYQQGNYPSAVGVGGGYQDSVSSIRGQGNVTLSSAPGSNYEMKFYSAPSTSGTPSLDKQIGNVSFAADCKW